MDKHMHWVACELRVQLDSSGLCHTASNIEVIASGVDRSRLVSAAYHFAGTGA